MNRISDFMNFNLTGKAARFLILLICIFSQSCDSPPETETAVPDNIMKINRTVFSFDEQWNSLDDFSFPEGFAPSTGKISQWSEATVFFHIPGTGFSFDVPLAEQDHELTFEYGIDPGDDTEENGPVSFSVNVNNSTAFTNTVTLSAKDRFYSSLWHSASVDLSDFRNSSVKLSFRIEGTSASKWQMARAGWRNISIKEKRTVRRTEMSGDKPNIIIILVDTLRADRLGFCGSYHRDLSPFLNSLAASSVVFENTYSVSTWTWPSVASLLTGLNPIKHGVGIHDDSRTKLSHESFTAAEHFQLNGFTTVGISANPLISPKYGFDQGFETFVTFEEFWETKFVPMPASGMNREFIKWLEGNGKNRFFAYLHYMDPHSPYSSPEPFFSRFSDSAEGEKALEIYKQVFRQVRFGNKDELISDDVLETLKDLYDSEVLYLDAMMSELFSNLMDKGYLDNTVILFTADHGEEFFEHGQLGHGMNLYDETLKIPSFLFFPKAIPPSRITAPVSITDFFPTLCDIASVPFPEGNPDGASLVKNQGHPGPQLLSTYHAFEPGKGRMEMLGLLEGSLKLVYLPHSGKTELYETGTDPLELKDLSEVGQEKRDAMKSVMLEMFEEFSKQTISSGNALPDAETIETLKALGYLN